MSGTACSMRPERSTRASCRQSRALVATGTATLPICSRCTGRLEGAGTGFAALLSWADETPSAIYNGGRPMKSDLELKKLIDTVEQQEHEAEEEIRHIREAARQLHIANS